MPQTSFQRKKQDILRLLSEPDYDDLSPKGSVDAEIRDFIDEINQIESLVTTSSCSGRISVFLEGRKVLKSQDARQNGDEDQEARDFASQGGKGGGGRWLYVSHQPVSESDRQASLMSLFQLQGQAPRKMNSSNARFVHLKFEPMILHILVASLPEAQKVLGAAQQAGFRESGIGSVQGLEGPVMVAVRTMGLAFDNIVGVLDETMSSIRSDEEEEAPIVALVDEEYLQLLVEMTDDKFSANVQRTQRFRELLIQAFSTKSKRDDWEDAEARRQRKREEGLRKREELKKLEGSSSQTQTEDLDKEEPNLELDTMIER